MTSYVKRVGDLTDPDGFVDCTYVTEANTDSAFDPVTKPSHYAGHTGIECKTAMESMLGTDAYTAYMQGCAFKYLWRWRDKNGIEDLKKARECIDNVIRAIEGDGECVSTMICLAKGFTSSTAYSFTPGFTRGLRPECGMCDGGSEPFAKWGPTTGSLSLRRRHWRMGWPNDHGWRCN